MTVIRHILALILLLTAVSAAAQPPAVPGLTVPYTAVGAAVSPVPQAAGADTTGGFMPALKGIFFGPRIGLESNEGKRITFIEKANLFVPLSPFEAYGKNGYRGFLASAFLGPRVGMQLRERKIRNKEWIGLVPVLLFSAHILMSDGPSTGMIVAELSVAGLLSRLWPAWEAYRGRTMREIDRFENLRK